LNISKKKNILLEGKWNAFYHSISQTKNWWRKTTKQTIDNRTPLSQFESSTLSKTSQEFEFKLQTKKLLSTIIESKFLIIDILMNCESHSHIEHFSELSITIGRNWKPIDSFQRVNGFVVFESDSSKWSQSLWWV
jgi:hypothetical protein